MVSSKDTFESSEAIYEFIETLISELCANGYDPGPLESVQQTAYTTGSEWSGDLRAALKEIQKQHIREEALKSSLQRVMKLVKNV
ncbi:hypothetical protein L0222_14850 [bacterium]|nr:hypothetical protein [bacterium]MCI0606144.1 hypothetical protein [bacterium]